MTVRVPKLIVVSGYSSRFDFSHMQFRDMVEKFAAAEIAPRAADVDRQNQFPMDLWKKMGELGILGVTAPGKMRVDDDILSPHLRHLLHSLIPALHRHLIAPNTAELLG